MQVLYIALFRGILSLARLPIPPPEHLYYNQRLAYTGIV